MRIFLYTKDVCLITGKGEKYARNLIKKVRAFSGKPYDLPITVFDLAQYLRIEPSLLYPFLR